MSADKTITVNRKARHEYEILESLEVGIVLTGTEIKSVRDGKVNLGDAYARPEKGELWIHNVHIAEYTAGNQNNHEPTRVRKLLLKKDQVKQLGRQVEAKGLTLIPLKLYLKKGHWAKVEIGLARGKKRYDKRRSIIDRERTKDAQQAIRRLR